MAGSALRRLARDRLALFFIVLLPVVIILIIGLTFGDAGSQRLPVGVVDQGAGPLGGELRAGLEASPALDARAYDDAPPPTYFLTRGDDRTPDKSRLITPGVPACLGRRANSATCASRRSLEIAATPRASSASRSAAIATQPSSGDAVAAFATMNP